MLLAGTTLGSALAGWVAAHSGAGTALQLVAGLSLTALAVAAWGASAGA